MECNSNARTVPTGLLDSFAVSMSLLCAVHCMITPVLLIALPILATSFWVSSNFHLWMMLLVIPTTVLAVRQGCKKHKDRLVVILSSIGLTTLFSVAIYEAVVHGSQVVSEGAHCGNCAKVESGSIFSVALVVNIVGGLFLTTAHVRNYILCRKDSCCD